MTDSKLPLTTRALTEEEMKLREEKLLAVLDCARDLLERDPRSALSRRRLKIAVEAHESFENACAEVERLTRSQEKAFWALDFLMQAPEYNNASGWVNNPELFLSKALALIKKIKEES